MKSRMTIAQARARIVKIRQRIYEYDCVYRINCLAVERVSPDLRMRQYDIAAEAASDRQVLIEELVMLKVAVQAANLACTVIFDNRTMCIDEALVRKDEFRHEAENLHWAGHPASARRRARLLDDIKRLSRLIEEANNRHFIDCR